MIHNTALILLADDDPDDRLMAFEAAEELGFSDLLVTVDDGQELLDTLRRRLDEGAGCPALILLDLNMPRMGGKEALQEIRLDPRLLHIPVVVFTTSASEEDIAEIYRLGVNSFITKPGSFAELVRIVDRLRTYWLETVKLPVG